MATPSAHTLTMLQRQMLLIEHVREHLTREDGTQMSSEEAKQRYTEWPVLSGMPLHDSNTLYSLMEELNLLYGFPHGGVYRFKTTGRYDQWLNHVRKGLFVADHPEPDAFESLSAELNKRKFFSGQIFIVHGEDTSVDEAISSAVVRHIRNGFGYEPVLLDIGRTTGYLMENFEKLAAPCAVAVCIWTADRDAPDSGSIRPNVMLETGYFIASLGLHRVIIIRHSNVKHPPSDLDGRAFLTEHDWDRHLAERLHEALASAE